MDVTEARCCKMNDKKYFEFVLKVEQLMLNTGKPFYVLAPQIGVTDKTLRRFLAHENVTINTVLKIAEFFKINIFGKYSEKVD